MITNAMTKAIKVANALGLTPGSWGRFLHRKSSEMMKSQAALKIIVMVTLLISDIDVFFLGVSIYEYWAAKFQIGLIAVFGMCGVYLGGVYFGAMQRFKLDATIIAYCEQGALAHHAAHPPPPARGSGQGSQQLRTNRS